MSAVSAEISERKRIADDFGSKERKIRSQMEYRAKAIGVPVDTNRGIISLKQLYESKLEDKNILLPIAPNEMGALGYMMMTGLRCVFPTCLDYSYKEESKGKSYTFEDIGGGVSGNAKILMERAPYLLEAIENAGGLLLSANMLVSDVEAADLVYQKMSRMDETKIRRQAMETRKSIEREVINRGLGLMAVGMMGSFVEPTDDEFGVVQTKAVGDLSKIAIGLSRSKLYQTMYERSNMGKQSFHDFMIGRVEADLQRYVALGAACRRQDVAIVDATAPEVARYYNVAADKYPVTPYIRIIDAYE